MKSPRQTQDVVLSRLTTAAYDHISQRKFLPVRMKRASA